MDRPFAVPIVFRHLISQGWCVLQPKEEENLELLHVRLAAAALCGVQKGLTGPWSVRLPDDFPARELGGPSAQLAALLAIMAERVSIRPTLTGAGSILVTGCLDGEKVVAVDNSHFGEKLRLFEGDTKILIVPSDNWSALISSASEWPRFASIPCWRPDHLLKAVQRHDSDLPARLVVMVDADELHLLMQGLFKLPTESHLRIYKSKSVTADSPRHFAVGTSTPPSGVTTEAVGPRETPPTEPSHLSADMSVSHRSSPETSAGNATAASITASVRGMPGAADGRQPGRAPAFMWLGGLALFGGALAVSLIGIYSGDSRAPRVVAIRSVRPGKGDPSGGSPLTVFDAHVGTHDLLDGGTPTSPLVPPDVPPQRNRVVAPRVDAASLGAGLWMFQRRENGYVTHCRAFELPLFVENNPRLREKAILRERLRGVGCPTSSPSTPRGQTQAPR